MITAVAVGGTGVRVGVGLAGTCVAVALAVGVGLAGTCVAVALAVGVGLGAVVGEASG